MRRAAAWGPAVRRPLRALCTEAFSQGLRSLPTFLFRSQDLDRVAKAAVLGLQLLLPRCPGEQVPDTGGQLKGPCWEPVTGYHFPR